MKTSVLRTLSGTSGLAYSYVPSERALLEVFEGVVVLDDLIELGRRAREDLHPESGGIVGLTDIREAELHLNASEMRRYVHWLREQSSTSCVERHAILVRTPRETGLALLFADLVDDRFEGRCFSTVEAARDWLDLEPSLVHRHLDHLRAHTRGGVG